MEKIDGMTCLMERKEIVKFMMENPCVYMDWRKAKSDGCVEGDLVALSVPSKSHPDLKVFGNIQYFSDTNRYLVICCGNFIKESFSSEDVKEIVERKKAPLIKEGDKVALIEEFNSGTRVRVMIATRLSAHTYPQCVFIGI